MTDKHPFDKEIVQIVHRYADGSELTFDPVEFEDMTDEQKRIIIAGKTIEGSFPTNMNREDLGNWIGARFTQLQQDTIDSLSEHIKPRAKAKRFLNDMMTASAHETWRFGLPIAVMLMRLVPDWSNRIDAKMLADYLKPRWPIFNLLPDQTDDQIDPQSEYCTGVAISYAETAAGLSVGLRKW